MVHVVVSQLTITKGHRLGGSNSGHLFRMVLEDGKSKMKVLADSVLGEVLLTGLPRAAFSLQPDMVERGSSEVSSSSYKGTNPILGVPPSWPHLQLMSSQRHHLLTTSHWELELQPINLGAGDTNIFIF